MVNKSVNNNNINNNNNNNNKHTRSKVVRLYLPRKEGGRELIGIEEFVRRESKSLQGGTVGTMEMCRKHGIECTDKWYDHQPLPIAENGEVRFTWYTTISTKC